METEAQYAISDSGERRVFKSGAQRDRGGDKPRPDLISPYVTIRFGRHMGAGAKKYDDHNWAKGMPSSEFWASAQRHMMQAATGDTKEDHLSAVMFNIMGIMHNEELAKLGIPEAVALHDFPTNWVGLIQGTLNNKEHNDSSRDNLPQSWTQVRTGRV